MERFQTGDKTLSSSDCSHAPNYWGSRGKIHTGNVSSYVFGALLKILYLKNSVFTLFRIASTPGALVWVTWGEPLPGRRRPGFQQSVEVTLTVLQNSWSLRSASYWDKYSLLRVYYHMQVEAKYVELRFLQFLNCLLIFNQVSETTVLSFFSVPPMVLSGNLPQVH